MNIFYCPAAVLNQHCVLDETESRHVAKVLRKRENEELYVFDGKGNLFDTRIEEIKKNEVTVHVVRLLEKENNDKPKLHIGIAPPKNIERIEWFAEKVTEIGAGEVTPLLCQRSERKELRTDRIEKIIAGACKQSMRLTIPKLNEMMKFEEFIVSINHSTRKYLAHAGENTIHLKDAYHGGFDAVIMIGPEGDFTNEEVALAEKKEFEPVSLGKNRLRLETAGIYAAAIFKLANEL